MGLKKRGSTGGDLVVAIWERWGRVGDPGTRRTTTGVAVHCIHNLVPESVLTDRGCGCGCGGRGWKEGCDPGSSATAKE